MRNFLIVTLSCFLALGCTTNEKETRSSQGLEETQLSTEFTDEGVKLYYTLLGKLEKIEVFGQAEVWKGNHEAIAEADALAKLVKFIYGGEVSTSRRISIIGRAIEEADDLSQQGKATSSEVIAFTDKELEARSFAKNSSPENINSAKRRASVVNETVTKTVTAINAKGRLVGVRKIRDYTQSNGKTYVAVYLWSEKNMGTADSIRQRMNRD